MAKNDHFSNYGDHCNEYRKDTNPHEIKPSPESWAALVAAALIQVSRGGK